ncbi:hypothetical protein EC396_13400 [Lutibacter sp. HS1-25]|uniref:hypothetical protein n=1 Tax=Lutibacter sp. HS1-25 TaxID=2485000 RepID=UPI001011617A|nr:hypothetical protein [Lutibacter sp. HS1-25]RXP46870.1 hypothetical protein EC396_13400 [Lutibacter sp. HS1-25]
MKNVLIFLGIIIIFFGCSDESDNSDIIDLKYSYEIKKILGSKVSAESNIAPNHLSVLKQFSYTIDTLEINLNGSNAGSFAFKIESSANIDIVTPARNIKPHVNYIKFIKLATNWENNKTKHIFLTDKYNSPKLFFSYSECNIDLSSYPELFINNPNQPTYTILEIKPKIGNDTEVLETENDYSVGQEITYNSVRYVVLSKS